MTQAVKRKTTLKSPRDVTIAVMGATGSGKTSFINMASRSDLRVGSGLRSCTMDIQVAEEFELDGCNVTIIDTPGFDDTTRTDTDILKLIAAFLSTSYEHGYVLSGVIYMHRISDLRMGGISTRNFSMFRKLCGDSTLKNVVICTTMWDRVSPEEGEAREHELANEDIFFKPVLDKHAQLVRHSPRTPESAQNIMRRLIRNQPWALQIQKELVDQRLDISQTAAGSELNKELLEQAERHREEMRELEIQMLAAIEEKDTETKAELEMERQRLRADVERVEGEATRMADEYSAQKRRLEEKLQEMEEQSRAEQARQEAEYQKRIEELRNESGGSSKASEEIAELRAELEKLRKQRRGGGCTIQ
ncbi:P-loop containing nucleoside triphosphate hydrolase protein [Rickenella mellea]|uniref:P-loop containing nucleoside triphosphate hydrolase protein n=1 Tax=Rickenella mellea TaxID=50990 RepID=A0A4Y7Q9B4_9AGAM|nr:P-loop containing nucleoside triphosphate hydrolase protein [Rickenella mellea]